MDAKFLLLTAQDEYIRAAPDAQLSSTETHLLSTLLSEEDQLDYNQLIQTTLPHDIVHILHQLTSLLQLSTSTIWTCIVLLKKLIVKEYSIDLLTIIASITLASKYQESSSQSIDYELIALSCHIQNIQLIHDAEMSLLDHFSYDICITTPDHFFSYLSNLFHNDDTIQDILEQARSLLTINTSILELLSKYSSSIVTLSLISNITSNTFIIEQIKSFLQHKKDSSHYLIQLWNCAAELQSATA